MPQERRPDPDSFDPDIDERSRNRPSPAEWAGLVLAAARRHPYRGVLVLLCALGAVVGYYLTARPMYEVEAKVLAQRQVVPPSLRSPSEESPARTAWEFIHRRENLVALVREAELLPPAASPPADAPARAATAIHPLDQMVLLLDRRLLVRSSGGTITISVEWEDPTQAYRIVEGALQNFIEARHVQEVTAIDEVISVLRGRVAAARENLEGAMDAARREARSPARDTGVGQRVKVELPASEKLVRMKSMIDAKERAIQDLEEFRRRRLSELHTQLDERRTVLSEAHPAIKSLRQDIEALSRESPQIVQLRGELDQLRAQYLALARTEPRFTMQRGDASAAPLALGREIQDDERVRGAQAELQQVQARVSQAELELDAARTAFKYRYDVIWPPQQPRDPVSPDPIKIFGAGGLAALVLALLAAAAPDLRSGRILTRWQIEKELGLTVLAEVPRR